MAVLLRLLGPFEATAGGRVTFPTRKAEALLAYLALPVGRAHARAKLAALLWGDSPDGRSRHSLRQAVLLLRKALAAHAPSVLVQGGDTVVLAPSCVATDVAEFEALFARGDLASLTAAIELYRGDFLEGMDLGDEAFEDWLARERSRLREQALAARLRIIELQLSAGDEGATVAAARSLLALDPLHEPTHRRLMQLYARSGQWTAALRQYRTCADTLRRELGVEPEAETVALNRTIIHAQLRQQVKFDAAGAAEVASPRPVSRSPSIAVLPLRSAGMDNADRALAEAISEDVVVNLSRDRSIRIAALRSDFDPNERPLDTRQLARQLDVRYVVEGSLRRLRDGLRVAIEIVDGVDGEYVWAEQWNAAIDGGSPVEGRIGRRIAAMLKSEIETLEARKAQRVIVPQLDAWAFYHLGMRELYRFTYRGLMAAREHLERAIRLDADFASAHARLAYVHIQTYWYGPPDIRACALDRALSAAHQAVALDRKEAHGHFAMGRVHALRRDFDRAMPALETAVDLSRSFAQAHFGLGQAHWYADRPWDAVRHLDTAIDINPHDPHLWTFFHDQADAYYALGDLVAAERSARAAARLPNATHWALATLASVLGAAGKREEASRVARRLLADKPEYSLSIAKDEFAHLQNEAFVACYVEGLRAAGLTS